MDSNSALYSELVFGLVYTVGTAADQVVETLKDLLSQFNYLPNEFRVSEHLRTLDIGIEFEQTSRADYMHALMTAGNNAREIASKELGDEDAGNAILAVMAANAIASSRTTDKSGVPEPAIRTAHIIRSLKRAEEVKFLRNLYRPGFFLIGIAANDDEQHEFLTERKGLNESEAESILARDRDEALPFGQRTRNTFYLADVFVELAAGRYQGQLQRFLDLVFGHPFITPRRDEHAMFLAYASSARSAQPGRQVGAAISTKEGEVNEVPAPQGGAYWDGDDPDHRDHRQGKDSNYESRTEIVDSVITALDGKVLRSADTNRLIRRILRSAAGIKNPNKNQIRRGLEVFEGIVTDNAMLRNLIGSSKLSDITEYGRAVHAEMDAILTCARLGFCLKGLILFTTTFPCHNCTRHIIACGISKVVYIEPYPKSKAKHLHPDAICFDEAQAKRTKRIPFLPFVGIGPRRYLDLFSLVLSTGRVVERKQNGNIIKWDRRSHEGPRVPMLPYNYFEREYKALDENRPALNVLMGEGNGKNSTKK